MRLFAAIKAFFNTLLARETAEAREPDTEGPAQVLSLLQREGRLIDFLREDIETFSDAQVGAAVRAVHTGCRTVLEKYLEVEAIRDEKEGDTVSVDAGFDPSAIRLSGKVTGDPPFRGILRHHGWRIRRLDLPQRPSGHDPAVIAPAEVEVV